MVVVSHCGRHQRKAGERGWAKGSGETSEPQHHARAWSSTASVLRDTPQKISAPSTAALPEAGDEETGSALEKTI